MDVFQKRRGLFGFNGSLAVAVLLITGLGLINLFSATQTFTDNAASPLFWNQLFYAILGILAALFLSFFSVKRWRSLAVWAYVLSLLGLVLVLAVGATVKGSQSWIQLGPINVQPSEFAKLGLILWLGKYLSERDETASFNFSGLILPFCIFLGPALLTVLQGDLGTSLFFGFIFFSMIILQGVRWRLLLFVVALVVGAAIVGYFFLLKPYQQMRIVSFMNPEWDARGSGYHLVQSKIAVGSGGWTGQGYLQGESNKLKYLPERHTDFIFPVLAQEWGFVGAFSVLALYFCLLMLGIRVAGAVQDRFAFFVSLGIVSLFFWHLVINLGGVLGLLPLTGVPLPFFSYGGSALLADWICIGILNGISREQVLS